MTNWATYFSHSLHRRRRWKAFAKSNEINVIQVSFIEYPLSFTPPVSFFEKMSLSIFLCSIKIDIFANKTSPQCPKPCTTRWLPTLRGLAWHAERIDAIPKFLESERELSDCAVLDKMLETCKVS